MALVSRTQAHLDAAKASLGENVFTVAADLVDADAADAMVRLVEADFGPVDILVNSAGAALRTRTEDLKPADWRAAMDAKFFSYIHVINPVVKLMAARGAGVIINIIGPGGKIPSPVHLAGGAANAALMLATAGLAHTYAARGVRVVGLNPGLTHTDRVSEGLKAEAKRAGITEPQALKQAVSRLAMGRLAEPAEIAGIVDLRRLGTGCLPHRRQHHGGRRRVTRRGLNPAGHASPSGVRAATGFRPTSLPKNSDTSSTMVNTAGITSRLRKVEVMRPPITATAMGERKLLSAAPQPTGDGQHAGAHGDGGHDDGTRALVASVQDGVHPVQAVHAPRFDGVFHQQDGVLGGHTHEHDQADQRRHGEALVGQQQRHEGPTQRQRQRRQDGEGMQERLEQQHQHDVDAQHAGQHGQAEAGEQLALHFGVADLEHLHALRAGC